MLFSKQRSFTRGTPGFVGRQRFDHAPLESRQAVSAHAKPEPEIRHAGNSPYKFTLRRACRAQFQHSVKRSLDPPACVQKYVWLPFAHAEVHEPLAFEGLSLRITFLKDGGFSMAGGDRVIAIYAERLMQRGHEVLVVARPLPRSTFLDQLRSLRRSGRLVSHGNYSHFDRSRIPHRSLSEYRPIVDTDLPDADVVIATWWETAHWVAALSPTKGAKVFFIQGYEIFEGMPAGRVNAAWRLPIHKIAVSRWLQTIAKESFGDSDISLVSNSVDHQQFYSPPRKKQSVPTAGYLYHPAAMKGPEVALSAISKLAEKMPALRLMTFGQHSFAEQLPRNIDHKHWQHPPQESIRDIYASCDVWLSTSHSEGFSLPCLEAMACRCPVVATRSGGPEDFIRHGENGYLAPLGDPQAISDFALQILQMENHEWQQMSEAAFSTASSRSWDDAALEFETAIQSAIDKEIEI